MDKEVKLFKFSLIYISLGIMHTNSTRTHGLQYIFFGYKELNVFSQPQSGLNFSILPISSSKFLLRLYLNPINISAYYNQSLTNAWRMYG